MLRVVQKAGADPVSLAEAKRHLRVDHVDDDELITALIAAATLHAQAVTQRLFVTQTVEWVLAGWQPCIRLPIAPVAKDGVVSIKYVDWTTQAQATLQPAQYVVQTRGPTVEIFPAYGTIWPIVFSWSPEPLVIQFVAGTTVDDVPANVKTAIKMIVGHLYENRESVVISAAGIIAEVPQGAQALLMSEVW